MRESAALDTETMKGGSISPGHLNDSKFKGAEIRIEDEDFLPLQKKGVEQGFSEYKQHQECQADYSIHSDSK